MSSLEQLVFLPLLLVLPVMVGGILHMIVVKNNWFRQLTLPLNQPAFGRNKTWRGILIIPLSCTVGTIVTTPFVREFAPPILVSEWDWLSLGIALGLAYACGELPNSFLKRRLGVAEGQLPERYRCVFFLMDHLDSATACCLLYMAWFGISFATFIATLVWSVIIHSSVNYGLFLLKIRKSPT